MPATSPKDAVKNSLAAIVAHPLRARVLGFLTEHTASPRQIATALGKDLGKVNYQVRTLAEMGKVEMVDTRPVRGATEHFYQAIERPWVNEEEWALLSPAERNEFALHVCQLGFTDAAAALASGAFGERLGNVVSRFPIPVDEEGWKELNKIHDDVMYRVAEVKLKSDARRVESGEEPIEAESFVLFFERDSFTDWKSES